jgi:ribose 1,5-bisphosphokinase PhnN
VRKERQVAHFRHRFASAIYHIHLTAPEDVLRSRYESRLAAGGEYAGGISYDVALSHPNEVASRDLINIADLVVDTTDPMAVGNVIAALTGK